MKTKGSDDQFMLPERWREFLHENSGYTGALEIVDEFVYDSIQYQDGTTVGLDFFSHKTTRGVVSLAETNMMLPNMLPAPRSMLIQEICVTGLDEKMLDGSCYLEIGPKQYRHIPLLWFYLHNINAFRLTIPLCIFPHQIFRFRIIWRVPAIPIIPYPMIRVALFGQMAKPVS